MENEYKVGKTVIYNGAMPEYQGKKALVINVVRSEDWPTYYVIRFDNGRTTEVIAKHLLSN